MIVAVGMLRRELNQIELGGFKMDLTGKKFGKWLVLESAGKDKTGKFDMWRCECECGTIKTLYGLHLRRGRTHSCGCGRKKIAKMVNDGAAE